MTAPVGQMLLNAEDILGRPLTPGEAFALVKSYYLVRDFEASFAAVESIMLTSKRAVEDIRSRILEPFDGPVQMKCPHCGLTPILLRNGLTVQHDYDGAVCPGSVQVPRNAESDRRPLWKDDPDLKGRTAIGTMGGVPVAADRGVRDPRQGPMP